MPNYTSIHTGANVDSAVTRVINDLTTVVTSVTSADKTAYTATVADNCLTLTPVTIKEVGTVTTK